MTGIANRPDSSPAASTTRATHRPPLERIRPNAVRPADVVEAVACGIAALALTAIIFTWLSPFSGLVGSVLALFGSFTAIYGLVAYETQGPLAARDRIATCVVLGITTLCLVPLFLILSWVLIQGAQFVGLNTLFEDLGRTPPSEPSTEGGAYHSLIGSMIQVGLATIVVVPLGIATAIFLNEIGGPLRRPVRILVDAMSGVPSVVAGLFIYTALILRLGRPFGAVPAALALSILMLPTVTRTALEVLRLVPDGLRESSLALGAPEWRTSLQVVVPTARSGIITAVILGMARVVGETAPVLFTAFGSRFTSYGIWSGPQDNLPMNVFAQTRSFVDADVERGFAAAVLLLGVVLALFTIARMLGRRRPGRRGVLRTTVARLRTVNRPTAHDATAETARESTS